MVCQATPPVNVYCSSDGREWVLREDYESLLEKSIITADECRAIDCICSVVKGLMEHATALTPDEKKQVSGWLTSMGNVIIRLAE